MKIKIISMSLGLVLGSSLFLTGCGGGGAGDSTGATPVNPPSPPATETTISGNTAPITLGVTQNGSLSITNSGSGAAQGLAATINGFSGMTVDMSQCQTLPAHASCTASITTTDSVNTGNGTLTISGDNVSNTLTIPVTITENVSITPQANRTHMFEYGVLVQNNQQSGDVTLSQVTMNLAGQTLNLATLNPDNNLPLCQQGTVIPAGQACELWLATPPNGNTLGVTNGDASLTLTRGGGHQISQDLTVSLTNNLYAVGLFNRIGNNQVNNIAKWDGIAWWPLSDNGSTGTDGEVYAIGTDNAGNLYFGGTFSTAGGVSSPSLVRYDGVHFYAMPAVPNNMIVHKVLANGNDLYIAGSNQAGNEGSVYLLKNNSWQDIGDFNGSINDMTFFNGALYVVGTFADEVSVYENNAWSVVGNSQFQGSVNSILSYNSQLYIGYRGGPQGDFAMYDNGQFVSLSQSESSNEIFKLAVKDGSVIALGSNIQIESWDGNSYSMLGNIAVPTAAYAGYEHDNMSAFTGGGYNYIAALNNNMESSVFTYFGDSNDRTRDLLIVPTLTVALPSLKHKH